MNAPISWIKEYTPISVNAKEFDADMTMSGSKVETVEYLGKDISKVVVGKVLEIAKHPDADKLVITQIDVGSETIQIVTGAANLNAGDYVPVALDGATLAGGTKIKRGKLRGVESNGMLCSIDELGYTKNDYPEAPDYGIYVFAEEQKTGADVVPILKLYEEVVEFEITSNRQDCFSVVGLAREAAATYRKPFTFPDTTVKERAGGNVADYISVSIQTENCLRYAARVIKNVKIEPSPLWLRHRLTASGIRPINNIVDVTNYVMLELGQPMHAFDIDNIARKKIIVRQAREDEVFVTLDENERKLDASVTVIADPEKSVAIAGVMGGENSKVTAGASAILLESACFSGVNIRNTSKRLGLRTDASSRYEKGLDPNLCVIAVNRAANLIELLGAGEVVAGVADDYPNPKKEVAVPYTRDGINKILGTEFSEKEIEEYLSLVEIKAENGVAAVPSFRQDIERAADLAEEVARLYGYDKIPVTLAGEATVGKRSQKQIIEEIIKNTLVSLGFCEAMSYSFESPKVFEKLLFPKDDRNTVKIVNPLGEDFSIMRTTLLGGILSSLSTNYNRRNEDAALFELAKTYTPRTGELPEERLALAIGCYGGNADFYTLKGVVEELFDKLGIKTEYAAANIAHMHPGRCAAVTGGYFGEIHPDVSKNYQIGERVLFAHLDAEVLLSNADLSRKYKPLPKFPAVKRDIAMLVPEDLPVAEIEQAIREKGGKFLSEVRLFDVYKGDQVEKGMKSAAYTLVLRSDEKTLTEEESSGTIGEILKNLETKIGAKLRS